MPTAYVLRHMRRHSQHLQVPDEVALVVGSVGAHCRRPSDAAFEHRHRGVLFGVAVGLGQLDSDDQAVAVLAQQMTEEAELRLLLLAPAIEPRLRDGRQLVRLPTAALAPPVVARSVASATLLVLRRLLVARAVALVRSPGVEQRAVYGEVIDWEQSLAPRILDHLLEQHPRRVRIQEPLSVLGARGRMERLVFDIQVLEPLEQDVVAHCSQNWRSDRTV